MAKILDPNLVVTKAKFNKTNDLIDLELNGIDIELGGEVPQYKKLYAWKNEDGTDPIYAYTAIENPKVGDIAIMPDASTLAIDDDPISAIGTDTITAFSTEFERDTTKDVVTVE